MQPKRHRRAPALRRLLRSPKGYLLRYLFLLALIALPGEPAARAGLGILTATAAAVAVDLAIERLRNRRRIVPDGAAITALLCALIISPHAHWYLGPAAAAIAIVSKHLIRVRWGQRT